ncbi:hypothetical protein [Sulfuricurvum sp.]|uniref:hypothetical protein n=1 Tax=Sulfuricurvum sp. TaxID=2025608 RepID=UPI003568EE67
MINMVGKIVKDIFTRKWIIENSVDVLAKIGEACTVRHLHYKLVDRGMTNDIKHYMRVVQATIEARWNGLIAFDAFVDHEREKLGNTDYEETDVNDKIASAKWSIEASMKYYSKNRWENQDDYLEVWVEKKAVIHIFQDVCNSLDVALCPCKGYPSLTFIKDASERFQEAQSAGKNLFIIYFGDYDPTGEDIPRSIKETFEKFQVVLDVERIALIEDVVRKYKLPPAPVKQKDPRTRNWDGMGQVELDALEMSTLRTMCKEAINSHLDKDKYEELMEQEAEEKEQYKEELVDFVKQLAKKI